MTTIVKLEVKKLFIVERASPANVSHSWLSLRGGCKLSRCFVSRFFFCNVVNWLGSTQANTAFTEWEVIVIIAFGRNRRDIGLGRRNWIVRDKSRAHPNIYKISVCASRRRQLHDLAIINNGKLICETPTF